MKILTNKEYQELLNNKNTDFEEKKEILELKKKIETLEKDARNNKEDYEILLKRKDLEAENAVITATQKLQKEVTETKTNNMVLEAKVEMYEKAFENLGFDVKDMKDILDKLVDGIVSKNTIQLVK